MCENKKWYQRLADLEDEINKYRKRFDEEGYKLKDAGPPKDTPEWDSYFAAMGRLRFSCGQRDSILKMIQRNS